MVIRGTGANKELREELATIGCVSTSLTKEAVNKALREDIYTELEKQFNIVIPR